MTALLFSAEDGSLRVEKTGAIATLVFSSPATHNAVTLVGWESLPEAVARIEADGGVRLLIVRGEGERAFVAGSNIGEFGDRRSTADATRHYNEVSDLAIERLTALDRPSIAVVRGYCLGGGVAIAVACDIRLAADDAVFGVPAARLGLSYRPPGIRAFLDLIGPAQTKEMLMTARRFTADEALRIGLVDRVVPVADLESVVEDYARRIIDNAPLTQRATKGIIAELGRGAAADAVRMQALVDACFASEDYLEGQRAFREKRAPRFRGR